MASEPINQHRHCVDVPPDLFQPTAHELHLGSGTQFRMFYRVHLTTSEPADSLPSFAVRASRTRRSNQTHLDTLPAPAQRILLKRRLTEQLTDTVTLVSHCLLPPSSGPLRSSHFAKHPTRTRKKADSLAIKHLFINTSLKSTQAAVLFASRHSHWVQRDSTLAAKALIADTSTLIQMLMLARCATASYTCDSLLQTTKGFGNRSFFSKEHQAHSTSVVTITLISRQFVSSLSARAPVQLLVSSAPDFHTTTRQQLNIAAPSSQLLIS